MARSAGQAGRQELGFVDISGRPVNKNGTPKGEVIPAGEIIMGDCRYCGKSAGFLRKEHKECAAARERGLENIRKVCLDAALNGVDVSRLPDRVRSISLSARLRRSLTIDQVIHVGACR